MAVQRFRGALNAADFPLVSSMQGRTVVQPQLDNNVRTTQDFYGTSESADYSIPQLLYCENVVPTAEGIQSVGYEEAVESLLGAVDFDQVITLRDADENNFLFCPAEGKNYIYTANEAVWVSTDPIDATGRAVSHAYVNGRTFICYKGLGIYEYDSVLGTFSLQVVVGIANADIDCIGASNNYLLIASGITVFWSSLIDPLDFVPSILTGAGFLIPQDVKANIVAVNGTSGGFIVYTGKNAVGAVYTNNIRAPFSFKEVASAGGVSTPEQIASDQSAGPQYAWTTGGLQKIVTQGAETLSAEINDFLAGRKWEYWVTGTRELVEVIAGATEFRVKVAYIASRYLIVSYSVDSSDTYQYAILFDTVLKRRGKLKFDHVDCFAYPYPNAFGDLEYADLETVAYEAFGEASYDSLSEGLSSNPPSKKTVAFLQSNGTASLLAMTYNKDEAVQLGVAIFGKFQLLRARMATLQYFDVEGAYRNATSGVPNIRASVMASTDGKNLVVPSDMTLTKNSKYSQRYAKRITGLNFAIGFEGSFAFSSYLLEMTAEGDR